jgi:hypothetical protein
MLTWAMDLAVTGARRGCTPCLTVWESFDDSRTLGGGGWRVMGSDDSRAGDRGLLPLPAMATAVWRRVPAPRPHHRRPTATPPPSCPASPNAPPSHAFQRSTCVRAPNARARVRTSQKPLQTGEVLPVHNHVLAARKCLHSWRRRGSPVSHMRASYRRIKPGGGAPAPYNVDAPY